MSVKIYNLDLERYLLGALLRHPETFVEIDGFINENDFVNRMHSSIFGIMRQTLRSNEKIHPVLLAQKMNLLNLSFEDKVADILGYLTDLSLIQISSTGVKDIADELKLFTVRREIAETGLNIASEMAKTGNKLSREQILSTADKMYNEKISIWDNESFQPENICSDLADMLENQANNPMDMGCMGPHPLLNNMFGSLFRPGNISVLVARAKCGKSTVMLDAGFHTSRLNNNIPVLYFDAGEMSKLETQLRLASSLSGVPMHYLEQGTYKKDKDMALAVEKIRDQVKNQNIYYYNVASKSVDEMINILKRFYMSKVGRHNKMLFVMDYLKSFSEKSSGNKAEWETLGIMLNKYKDVLSTEVPVGMLTAAQSNRSGIVTNKKFGEVIESEEVVGGSDRIVMYSSQVFLLRKKINEEILAENNKFGSHKLIPLVTRHLGRDVKRALSLVRVGDSLRPNYINYDISGFRVVEKNDLQDMARQLEKMNISSAKVQDVSL